MFAALRGQGATLTVRPIATAQGVGLADGSVGVEYSNRVETMNILPVVQALLQRRASFWSKRRVALSKRKMPMTGSRMGGASLLVALTCLTIC